MTSIEHDGFLDFGKLPEALQETIIAKLLNPDHHATPQMLINGLKRSLKAWLDDALTQNDQTPTPQVPEAYTIAAHGKQTTAIHAMMMTQIPSPPSALDPNDILEKFLVADEFHFLKSRI
jgi:hypothetical protein